MAKTIRQNSKLLINEFLKKAKLITWRTFSPNYQMHGLVIIACNKLNPFDPWRAYRYLRGELDRYTKEAERMKGSNETKQQRRLSAIKREMAMMQEDNVCPCCGGIWDGSELLPDDVSD